MTTKYFNKEGHLNLEGTALVVDAMKLEKTGLLPEVVKDHVESCGPCHEAIIGLYSTIADQDYSNQGSHPVFTVPARKTTIRKLIFRVAAAAVLAAFAFYFYNQNSIREVPDDNKLVQEDTLKDVESSPFVNIPKDETKIDQLENYEIPEKNQDKDVKNENQVEKAPMPNNRQLFAMNYTPNAEFEDFVGEVFRSAGFQLNKPENEAVFKVGGAISFSWNDPDNKEWYLLIFNNRGAEIHNVKTTSENYTAKEALPPGLYYWRLETMDDLLHVGKFFIE